MPLPGILPTSIHIHIPITKFHSLQQHCKAYPVVSVELKLGERGTGYWQQDRLGGV